MFGETANLEMTPHRCCSCYCCCAGPAAAPASGGPAPHDIVSLLCSIPTRVGWHLQEEVETELGIEPHGVRDWFIEVGRRQDGTYETAVADLASRGVYRELLGTHPKRVWGVAFAGVGGSSPVLPEWCNTPRARAERKRQARAGRPGRSAGGAGAAAASSSSTAVVQGQDGAELSDTRYAYIGLVFECSPCLPITDKRLPHVLHVAQRVSWGLRGGVYTAARACFYSSLFDAFVMSGMGLHLVRATTKAAVADPPATEAAALPGLAGRQDIGQMRSNKG